MIDRRRESPSTSRSASRFKGVCTSIEIPSSATRKGQPHPEPTKRPNVKDTHEQAARQSKSRQPKRPTAPPSKQQPRRRRSHIGIGRCRGKVTPSTVAYYTTEVAGGLE